MIFPDKLFLLLSKNSLFLIARQNHKLLIPLIFWSLTLNQIILNLSLWLLRFYTVFALIKSLIASPLFACKALFGSVRMKIAQISFILNAIKLMMIGISVIVVVVVLGKPIRMCLFLPQKWLELVYHVSWLLMGSPIHAGLKFPIVLVRLLLLLLRWWWSIIKFFFYQSIILMAGLLEIFSIHVLLLLSNTRWSHQSIHIWNQIIIKLGRGLRSIFRDHTIGLLCDCRRSSCLPGLITCFQMLIKIFSQDLFFAIVADWFLRFALLYLVQLYHTFLDILVASETFVNPIIAVIVACTVKHLIIG